MDIDLTKLVDKLLSRKFIALGVACYFFDQGKIEVDLFSQIMMIYIGGSAVVEAVGRFKGQRPGSVVKGANS